MKILIVDDNNENLYLLDALLKGNKYETVSAGNGMEALAALERDKFDMIISDILMPKMDGFQLCMKCKKDAKLRNIPFVFTTSSYTEAKDEEFGKSIGAEAFIVRPIEPAIFIKLISELFGKKRVATPTELNNKDIEFHDKYSERLASQLEHKISELGNEIASRQKTEAELKKKVAELERFYKITMDREDKIIDMKKKEKDVVKLSADYLNSIINAIADPVFVKDKNFRFVIANDALCKMHGMERKDILGKTLGESLPADQMEHFFKIDKQVLESGIENESEEPLTGKDGKIFTIVTKKTLYVDPQNNKFVIGVIRDVTGIKLVEKEIKKMAKFPEEDINPVIRVDKDGTIIYGNPASKKCLAYHDTAVGKPIYKELMQPAMEAFSSGKTGSIELPCCKDHVLSFAIVPLKEEGYVNLYGMDITERKKAEDSLLQSENIFNSFLEHSPIYIFFKDEKIRSIKLSRNFETMLGRPIAELLNKDMNELFPSALAKSMIVDDMRILKEGKEINIEEELNGRTYSTIKFPIQVEGKPRYLAGFNIDITERRQAENAAKELKDKIMELKKEIADLKKTKDQRP